MTKSSNDNTTIEIFNDEMLNDSIQSDMGFDDLDDVVYNSSSSFDISEISDILLDSLDDFVFITDAVTKNIVYINKPLSEALGIKCSFVGTCHSVLRGSDSPCKGCKLGHIVDDGFYVTSQLTSKFKEHYVIKTKKLDLYNRTYMLNLVLKDNSNIYNSFLKNNQNLSLNDLIAPFISIYTDNILNPDVQLYRFIECLGIQTDAENCSLYEHYNFSSSHDKHEKNSELEKSFNRTHIWVSDKVNVNEHYTDVRSKFVDKAFTEQIFCEYADMENNDSYIAIPLEIDLVFLGTLFIKNPDKKLFDILKPAIKTVLKFLSSAVEHRRMHSELCTITNRDTLTNLKNRKSMLSDINMLSLSEHIGIIFLNVNGLKQINVTLGMKDGDTILVKTASLLKQLLHNSDYIYRIGGDEFIGIQPNIEEHDFFMLSDMLKAFMTSEKGFSVSVGTHWERNGMMIQKAINLAESDMYVEKKNYYRLHPSKNSDAPRYRPQNDNILSIIEPDRIKELITNNNFKVLYQPKFKIQGDCAQIAGAEALVRLVINDTIIPPDDFIPALEAVHYTHLIDYFVFETICRQMRERIDNNLKVLPVSCNFSRHTIVRPEFKTKLKSIMKAYDISYDLIPLEVSEHTNTELHKELVEVTDSLAQEGFNISIDDFGTAHANIYTLADLSVNEVKFDKKLIDNIASADNGKITTILSVLITMCKNMGIKTIAEGVEDKAQSDILKKLGCDEIQGYYYSRPIKDLDYYEKF